jgi:cation transport regulator ChaC
MRNNLNESIDTEYYFAYGSNMDEYRFKVKRKITFYEKFSGKLNGYELIFNKIASRKPIGIAYSNIQPKENSNVEGIIYKINPKDFEKLDKDEGHPNHYGRKSMLIETQNGPLKCEVYIAKPNKIQAELKPEREYLNHILAGKGFLSDQYYSNLRNTPTFD